MMPLSVQELCRVELISETSGDAGSPVQTYKVTNADESVCDVVVKNGLFGKKTAYCVRHDRHDDCEGTARLHCSIDFTAEREAVKP